MIGRLWWQWFGITILILFGFAALDWAFGTSTPLSFVDAGILSFISIWCAKNDESRKGGRP